jgi:hypothetical protein
MRYAMKLMTKAIEKELPPLLATEGTAPEHVSIIIKYFCPWGSWTFYVIEGEKEGDDWRFYGMVHGEEKELGFFLLSDLSSIVGPWGLRIERELRLPYTMTLAQVM